MSHAPAPSTSHALPLGMLTLLWLVGWTLRVPILSAPPLALHIAETFGLGEAGIGALTMLPIVTVAFGAIPAAWIIGRVGLKVSIVGGILVMAAASVSRGYVPTSMALFAASAVMGLGVSVFQTALPAATRVWTPTHVAMGSAVYLNGMMVGELSGAGLTLPIVLPMANGSWQNALLLWAIPIVLIAVLVVIARLPKEPSESVISAVVPTGNAALPRWNDPKVWQYGLLLSGTVVAFYVINAFAGTVLRARGEQEALDGLLLAYNATPLLASFAVLAVPKWIGRRGPIAISAIAAILGLAIFTFTDGWLSWAAALVSGFAATIELILLVSLPPAISKGIAVTRLSAGMTLIGYAIAFILPLIGGVIADRTGIINMALIPSLLFAIAVLPAMGRQNRYPQYD